MYGFSNGSHELRPLEPMYSALIPVFYTHFRPHETVLDLVCRLLLEKKKKTKKKYIELLLVIYN
eukprot:NODE_30590_length_415_cov_0.673611.p3 GENE.NODE_30590_length_415_cov_0.673611~~NODE_30590_length_415_cov_0.673611.p3  ORF type:complete len:64 (+),score=1.49 NODE_30590_length_415_cov_0.673611:185-376(+)